MPTYDYHCAQCGHQMEKFQKISEEPCKECPSCKQLTLQRGVGGGTATLLFKGKGFYITDYRNTNSEPVEQGNSKAGCACKGTHSCN